MLLPHFGKSYASFWNCPQEKWKDPGASVAVRLPAQSSHSREIWTLSRLGQRSSLPFHRGFTLLELVIVMTLLAIIGGIAMPRYTASLAHHRAEAAARRIAADLAYLRQQARFTSSSKTIAFDLATHQYSGSITTVSLGDDPYKAVILSVDFGGDAEIVFDGYGIPDSGGTVLIQAGHRQKTITLDGDSGRVTVQ